MKKYAVIVAGGSGSRMGAGVPKQFLLLAGKPVLWYTLEVFLGAYPDLEIILVVPGAFMEEAGTVVALTQAPKRVQMVAGGETRFHSVQNGLGLVKEESVVFVHDGVRCLASAALIRRCYEQAVHTGSAIPVTDCKDSVRLLTEAGASAAFDRNKVKLVQTPQTFLSTILLPSYGLGFKKEGMVVEAASVGYKEEFTDEATVVEAAGYSVHLAEGEPDNIKITVAADLVVAELILSIRKNGANGKRDGSIPGPAGTPVG
jgi:2-C-methyl-D-erythritol 4-phosphate cytidylyltransferase